MNRMNLENFDYTYMYFYDNTFIIILSLLKILNNFLNWCILFYEFNLYSFCKNGLEVYIK